MLNTFRSSDADVSLGDGVTVTGTQQNMESLYHFENWLMVSLPSLIGLDEENSRNLPESSFGSLDTLETPQWELYGAF